jgi:hypothetical protein
MLMSDADSQNLTGPLEPAAPGDTMPELAGYIVNGLFSVGLSLESARSIVGNGPAGDRIAAATDQVDHLIRDIRTALLSLPADRGNPSPDRWPQPPGGHTERTGKLLGSVVKTIFTVGGHLQTAADLPQEVTRMRITEALHWLDDLAGQIRDYMFTENGRETPPGPARRTLPNGPERLARTADRLASLRARRARTAHALQAAAADAAALLEQQAELAKQPGRMDYPPEIKRWRAFAEQAEQMARRWEQPQ